MRKTNEYKIREVTLYQELSKYAFEIEKLSEMLTRSVLAKETENTHKEKTSKDILGNRINEEGII